MTEQKQKNRWRSLATQLMNRARFSNVAGVTYEGSRDLYTALGYKRILTPSDYRGRYLRNAVAARIVEAKPQDTWRGGGEVIEDDDPDTTTEFEKQWADLNDRLNLWTLLQRTDILAGLGHYAVLLLGAPGEMNTPLVTVRPEELYYVTAYPEEDATVTELETEITNPRFGMPTFYEVKRTQIAARTSNRASGLGKRVHHTRIIHIADGVLDDPIYGTPRLERCWNLLDDLEKVTGGGAEAFWRRADQGMQLDIDPTLTLTSDQVTELENEVEDYTHGLKKIMRTRGLKINTLGSDVAGFKDPVTAIIEQLSAGTGIPQRILMGSEQAKLASTQDRTNWDERIEARRADFAGPQVVRPFVDRLIELGVLPEPKTPYFVQWSQIRTADDGEKADLANSWANLNQKVGVEVVSVNEIRTQCLGLEAQDEDQQLANELKESLKRGKDAVDKDALRDALAKGDKQAVVRLLRNGAGAVAKEVRKTIERDAVGQIVGLTEARRG